ncbi:hypothetical protein MUP65_01850 [Patescibacteria group bacterium]|nr:hypothetical protein [Patescibacteria group bacterium]
MWRKKATSISLVLLAYLTIISFLRFQWSWRWGLFWLGTFFGTAFFNFDHILYLIWQDPQDPNTAKLKELFATKKLGLILDFLSQTARSRPRLVAHSIVFQIALVVLGFFTLTSTAVLFGQGMVMGLLLYPLLLQAQSLMAGRSIKGWFWQVDWQLDRGQQAAYFLIMFLFFLFYSFLLI